MCVCVCGVSAAHTLNVKSKANTTMTSFEISSVDFPFSESTNRMERERDGEENQASSDGSGFFESKNFKY